MGKRSTASTEGGRTAKPPAVTASAAGTSAHASAWAHQFAPDFFRPTRTGLTVSALAVGTYLGESDDETDALYTDALGVALTSGVNVIDTAINYRNQRSERCVGAAVHAQIEAGNITRESVVLCTKAGYIPLDGNPPASRDEYQRYLQREYFDTGILDAADVVSGGHSISPRFLEDQLHRSLRNLGVGAVDYFFIHNPEQQLSALQPDVFYEKMRRAFESLESCVKAGVIGAYGCATWSGLRLPAESRGHLSLYRLAAIAREVAGDDHHFRIAQLPVNLSMGEAVRASTQRDRKDRLVYVVDAANELGIDLMVSAPLLQGGLTHDLPPALREVFPGHTDAQRALGFPRSVPGVATIAVGTRRIEHLRENLAAFQP
jgi:aryl-alcohol dehydrogenase-like predicted oxidoreductase